MPKPRMSYRRCRQIDNMSRDEFRKLPKWEQVLYYRTPMPPAQFQAVWATIRAMAETVSVADLDSP